MYIIKYIVFNKRNYYAVVHVHEVFLNYTSLFICSLKSNNISAQGARALAGALKVNQTLQELE